jgi:hypothetical protein
LAAPPDSQLVSTPVGLHRQLLFVGDSVVRQTFFASTRLLDSKISKSWETEGEKHSDREIVISGDQSLGRGETIKVTFWW